MQDNRITETISVAGAKDDDIKRAGKSSSVDVEFSIGNVSRRYKVGEIIGSGGNSTIVEAVDRDLKRTVAIKLLKSRYHDNPRAVGRFLNEARIMSSLQHPGVVPVHEVGFIGNRDFFFSMKKVIGTTLRDRLNGDLTKISGNELLNNFFRVCETMAFAHEKGIVHRDLKPENIMIESYGSVLIMDWGLGKDIHCKTRETIFDFKEEDSPSRFDISREDGIELTINGEISGTPAYMSPEQSLGMMHQMDTRSDIFSLGIILYEIITGRNPFSEGCNNNYRQIFEMIKHQSPALPETDFKGRRVPKELIAICMKCLEKLPDNRYSDARHLYSDLSNFRQLRPVTAYRTGMREEVTKWCSRHTRSLVLAGCFTVLLTVAGVYRSNARAEVEGLRAAAQEKIEMIGAKDEQINKLSSRLQPQSDIIANHRQQRWSDWQTAKSLILYTLNKQGHSDAAHLVFLKHNWLKEISLLLERGSLYEADRSLTAFESFIGNHSDLLDDNSRRQLDNFHRKLGRTSLSRHN